MSGKVKFDQAGAFRAIVGVDEKMGLDAPVIGAVMSEKPEIKKRVNLMISPSHYAALRERAYEERMSMSQLVSNLLVEYLAKVSKS